jgi:hypothetical protein
MLRGENTSDFIRRIKKSCTCFSPEYDEFRRWKQEKEGNVEINSISLEIPNPRGGRPRKNPRKMVEEESSSSSPQEPIIEDDFLPGYVPFKNQSEPRGETHGENREEERSGPAELAEPAEPDCDQEYRRQ